VQLAVLSYYQQAGWVIDPANEFFEISWVHSTQLANL
jgi:hypothetical protein